MNKEEYKEYKKKYNKENDISYTAHIHRNSELDIDCKRYLALTGMKKSDFVKEAIKYYLDNH